jgi:hypothetical protein
MNIAIVFIALVLTLFSATIVCLALASRPPRCALCNGRIVVGDEQDAVCEDCNSPWTKDDYQ